jgi:hypothetical protein
MNEEELRLEIARLEFIVESFGFKRNREKGGEVLPLWYLPDGGDCMTTEELVNYVNKN